MIYSTVFMPYEVGDYSLFIREDLKDYTYVFMMAEDNLIYVSNQILPSESGTIIYFESNIKDNFLEGHIYRARCYMKGDIPNSYFIKHTELLWNI